MNKLLNRLSILSFLILLLPFFQTCSDKNITENRWLKNSPVWEEVLNVSESEKSTNKKEYNLSWEELNAKKKKAINTFLKCRKELTYNGYEMSIFGIDGSFYETIIEDSNYIFLAFTFVIFLCGFVVFYSYKLKYNTVLILSICNFCLSLIPLIFLYLGEFLEDINQIKFGYYLFLINLLLIIYLSIALKKKSDSL